MIVEIEFTTDGSGAVTVVKDMKEMKSYARLVYAVSVIGTNLTGGTLVLKTINTVFGVDTTILSLAAANVTKLYLPRIIEHGVSGSDETGKTMVPCNGGLQITIASGGANKTGKVVIQLI